MKKLYILFSLSLVCLTVKPQNTALDFDGVDDHIEVPHSNTLNLNDFTLEAWVKTTSTGANERIISKNSGANQCYTLVVDNGLVAVAFNTAGGGNNVSGSISMNDGNWHHIAGVRNASTNTLSIFVDGVLDNSTGTTGIPVTGTEPLNIGRFPTNIQYFDGQMDEVRIWGRALTQSDILTNINQTLVGNESDLVAYYNFEEGTPNGDNSASGSNVTQVIDKAGANTGGVNNFTRDGTSSNWVNGKPFSEGNTVLDFDGGDNIEVPHDNSFNLDDFTLEAWVKTTSAGANERIITKTAGASQSFSLFVDNGLVGVGFSTGGGGNFMSGSISMNDGNWHHIAGVRNASSNTLSLYVDGVLDNSISTTGTPVTGTDPLNIGRFSSADPTKQRYNGQMDEVRIWNTALSQSDLKSRMTTPLAGDEVGLVAYFPFEEGVGNEDNSSLGAILDMAGGNTGTPIGFAQTGNSSNWISETSFITTSANTNVAMDFDGVDDFIDIPNNASLALDDFTLEAWVNTTSTVAYSRVIAKPSGGFANYSLMVHNGIVGVGFDTGLLNNYIYGSTTVNDGNWHHIVGVRSASTNMLYIYVDGMLDVSSSTTGTPLISTESLRIGLFGGAYAQRYQGRLDEIRIWNRALDQKEIVSNMNQTLMGSETGLVAYYKLEEGTPNGDNSATGGNVTQVIDQTGTNNGTVYSFARNGSSSNWVNGKAFSDGNTALDFDGVNDYIDVNSNFTDQVFSIEMWVKPGNSQVTHADIIDNNHTGFQNWVVQQYINDLNKYRFAVFRASGGIVCEFTLAADLWQHVTLIKNISSLDCYVNGTLINTVPWTGTINYNAQFLRIGRWGGGGRNWNGELDEVRIWNRALTQAEILCQMNASLTGTKNGLLAYYDFEEGVELGNNQNLTKVFDKAGINDGTLSGFAKTGIGSNWVIGQELEEENDCVPVITLSGNGQTIVNGATPEMANHTFFGKLANGVSLIRTFTITNSGSETVTLSGSPIVALSGSGDFSVSTQPAVTTLNPGVSTTFQVTFTPTGSGIQSATLSVESTDPNSPFTFEIQGSANTAMDFDGSDDRFLIPWKTDMATQEFTYEFWVKQSIADQMRYVTKWSGIGGGTTGDFLIDSHYPGEPTNGQHLRFVASNGGAVQARVKNVLTVNSWNHVAVSFNNGNVKMYVNGVNVLNTNITLSNISHNNFDLEFGTDRNGVGRFNGQLDELRIWNRELCQAEIQGRMNACLQGNEEGLITYYDFEDGIPGGDNTGLTEVKDKAGTNHGTPSNFDQNGASSNWVNGKDLTDDGIITATTNTWLGTSTDWNTASNWSGSSVPAHCDDVLIPVTANDPTFGDNQAVNSITIEEGATLTLSPGGCLWVGSTATNNGSFVLQANSSNFAQYMGPQVEGTLEQVIDEEGWHTIASPFIDATLEDISMDQNAFLQFGTAEQTNIHFYDGGTHQASPPGTWANAWGSWVPASGLSDPFNGSRAYALYLDNLFADGFPVKLTVNGTLRNMPITQELNGANGGWNLMSNPFPSVINWEKWHDNSNILNTYYLWDAAANGGTGQYYTYMSGGTSVPAATLTEFIAPYQAVFVRTDNGVSINSGDEPDVWQDHLTSNADRPTECPSVINGFFKTGPEGEMRIQAMNRINGYTDELLIRLKGDYSWGFNADEDAQKFIHSDNEAPSIFARLEEKALVIASYPYPDLRAETIPLGYSSVNKGEIKLELLDQPENMIVILEDTELEIFHNLKMPYTFSTNHIEEADRFKLHMGSTNSNIYSYVGGNQLVFTQDGKLVFYDSKSLAGSKFTLLNIAGQELKNGKIEEGLELDVSNYPTGVYLLKANLRGEVKTQKLIIK